MSILFTALLTCYAAGVGLPVCLPGRPKLRKLVAHSLSCAAGLFGIALGLAGLVASEPLTLSAGSSIPYLSFAIRLDPLAACFVLTISLVGLAASIYAFGYVTEFYGRHSIGAPGSLFNGFLFSMTLVVMADNGFCFLIAWELMSLVSYFLVVTEHEKANVRYAGFCIARAVQPGLIGMLVVEPRGSRYLSPFDGKPMASGWEAMIEDPKGAYFREFSIFYHEAEEQIPAQSVPVSMKAN